MKNSPSVYTLDLIDDRLVVSESVNGSITAVEEAPNEQKEFTRLILQYGIRASVTGAYNRNY